MPEYKVTDPGSGKTVVLTGESPPTEEEIEEVFSSVQPGYTPPTNFQEGIKDDVTMFGNIAEQGVRGLYDNAWMFPNAVGDVVGTGLAAATAGVHTAGSMVGEGLKRNLSTRPEFNWVTGEPLNFRDELSENYESAKNTWPASTLLGGYNAPTSIGTQALLSVASEVPGVAARSAYHYRTPGEYDSDLMEQDNYQQPDLGLTTVGERFAKKRDEILEGVLQRREAHPIGAGAGDVLADVATVVMGRAPIVNAQRTARLGKMKSPTAPVKEIDPGLKRFLNRKTNEYKDWFKTSGYNIAETGVEGAVLAALQDEDPLIGAAFGAGTQSVANISQHIWEEIPDFGMKPGVTRVGAKAGVAAFAVASLVQIFKELTPAGRDRILESEESGYKKAGIAMAIGAMTQATGFGRPTKGQLDDLGLMIDTWHSARRASVMSLVSEMENDDSGDIARVWAQVAENPSYFNATAYRRLNRAFENDDVSMGDAIESLMETDRKFRRKVIDLRGERSDAPLERTREKFNEGLGLIDDRIGRMIEE